MSISKATNKKKPQAKPGAYVAMRRATGVIWAITADHYDRYGEEYEQAVFYKTFQEAAEEADRLNNVSVNSQQEDVNIFEDQEALEAELGDTIVIEPKQEPKVSLETSRPKEEEVDLFEEETPVKPKVTRKKTTAKKGTK